MKCVCFLISYILFYVHMGRNTQKIKKTKFDFKENIQQILTTVFGLVNDNLKTKNS